jgi:hypothetical protein
VIDRPYRYVLKSFRCIQVISVSSILSALPKSFRYTQVFLVYSSSSGVLKSVWHTQVFPVYLNFDQIPAQVAALPLLNKPYLIFWLKYSISPRVSQWPMQLANMGCWICHNPTEEKCGIFSVALDLRLYVWKCCSIAINPDAGISDSDTTTQYCTHSIYSQMELVNMRYLISCNESNNRSRGFPSINSTSAYLTLQLEI